MTTIDEIRTAPAPTGRLSPEQDFRALVSAGLLSAGDLLLHEAADGHVQQATVVCDGCVALSDGTVHPAVAALSAAVAGRNGWKNWRHDATGRTLAELHITARSRNA